MYPCPHPACTLSASNAYVSYYSTLTLTLVPANQIPSGGLIVISLPSSWASDPLSAPIIQSTPACAAQTGLSGSTLTCTYSASQSLLTVSGITPSLSSAFSFSIASILTPPTVGSGETLSIYSQWSDGTQIDFCTAVVQDEVAAPFQSKSLTSNDNHTVQTAMTATLKLTLSRTFSYQDTITLLLPSEFAAVSVSSSNFGSSFTKTPGLNNTLTLSNFPSTTPTIAANNAITFTLANAQNPLSTAPIYLNVSFYRSNQIYQTSVATYSATSGTLDSLSIGPSSNFVQAVGQATITLVSSLAFPPNAVITLTYPSAISAPALSSASLTRCTLNSSIVATASYLVQNNQIVFTNIFASAFAGTVTLTLSTFLNPPTTQPSLYTLSVTDQDDYAVMTGSYSLTANTRALVSNSVSASSTIVLTPGTTYTLSITTNFPFTAVSIIVPSDISIAAGYSNTCAPSSFSQCVLVGSNLTFVGSLSAGSYNLSWGYTTNPNSE